MEKYAPNKLFVGTLAAILACAAVYSVTSYVEKHGYHYLYWPRDVYEEFFYVSRSLRPGEIWFFDWVGAHPESEELSIVWFDGTTARIKTPYRIETDQWLLPYGDDFWRPRWDGVFRVPAHMVTGFVGTDEGFDAYTQKFATTLAADSGMIRAVAVMAAFFAAIGLCAHVRRSRGEYVALCLVSFGLLVAFGQWGIGESVRYEQWMDQTRQVAGANAEYIGSRRVGGNFLPLPPSAFDSAQYETRGSLPFGFTLAFCGFHGLVLLAAYGVAYITPGMPAWLHFVFVPHPASRSLRRAGAHKPLDGPALVDAIRRGTPGRPPPVYVSENITAKAKAHTERLRADAELMRAAREREIAGLRHRFWRGWRRG